MSLDNFIQGQNHLFIVSSENEPLHVLTGIIAQKNLYLTYLDEFRKIGLYMKGEKSSWPSLRETRDKRPLGSDPDRSWCHRHTNVIELSW